MISPHINVAYSYSTTKLIFSKIYTFCTWFQTHNKLSFAIKILVNVTIPLKHFCARRESGSLTVCPNPKAGITERSVNIWYNLSSLSSSAACVVRRRECQEEPGFSREFPNVVTRVVCPCPCGFLLWGRTSPFQDTHKEKRHLISAGSTEVRKSRVEGQEERDKSKKKVALKWSSG